MTILYLTIIILSGVLLSYLIIKKLSLGERLSLSVGLGILLYSIEYFVILSLGIALTTYSVTTTIIVTALILFIANIRNKNIFNDVKDFKFNKNILNMPSEKKYLFLILSIIGLLITITAVFWPISEWDALTLYDFRGKVYADGLLFKDVQKLDSFDKFNAGYYFSYPPSTSLIHASFYVLGSDRPQIIYPAIYFSLIAYFYFVISKYANSYVSILTTSVLMLINTFVNHASVPYTNLPYTYFYFLSTILLIEYLIEKKGFEKIIMSGLFLAGSIWIRSVEPFYLVNILVFLTYSVIKKENILRSSLFIIPVVFIKLAWSHIQNNYAAQSFLNNISYINIISNLYISIPTVIQKALQSYISFIGDNGLIFGVLSLNTILYFLSKDKYKNNFKGWLLIIIYTNLGIILVGTIAIGILVPGRMEIYDSLGRFGIFLYPMILFISGLSLKEFIVNKG